MYIKNILVYRSFLLINYLYLFIYVILQKKKNFSFWYQIINILNSSSNIIILLILILILKNIGKNFHKTTILLIMVLIYKNYQYNIFIHLNSLNSINFNLINGIMLIHPILLYTLYSLFFILVLNILIFSKKFLLKNNNLITYSNKLLVITILTLFLGSYWAEQELFWGGWWSWDFVELILLNILIYLLYIKHLHFNNFNILKKLPFLILNIIIISIVIVRYNIINSIHNFINNDNYNQYDYYIIMLIILLIISLLYLNIYKDNNIVGFFFKFFLYTIILLFLFNVTYCFYNKIKNIFFILLNISAILLFIKFNKFNKINSLYIYFLKNFTIVYIIVYKIIIYLLKYTKKNKVEHICILIYFCILNNQIQVFNIVDLIDISINTKTIKINNLLNVDSLNKKFFFKQKIFLEDTFNLNNIYTSIFEKNIYNINNNELYNYNNQYLIQLYLNLLYIIPIIIMLKLLQKYFYFLNKEHCSYINI